MVIDRLIAEADEIIEAAVFQLEGMTPPQPPFYYRLIGAHASTISRRIDKGVRQVLLPMVISIYEALEKTLMILRTTEHSLDMLIGTLDNVVFSLHGKSIRDRYLGGGYGYLGEEVVAVKTWESIFGQLSPDLSHRSAMGPAYFYGDARQAKEGISTAEATMMALQDRLVVFQRMLQVAPFTTIGNALELCTRALRIDREELRASRSYAKRTQKESRGERRTVLSFLNSYRAYKLGRGEGDF